MAMENGPVEDVLYIFPIENGDFPASHVSLLEGSNFHQMFQVHVSVCIVAWLHQNLSVLSQGIFSDFH